jgi:hypothetical protein
MPNHAMPHQNVQVPRQEQKQSAPTTARPASGADRGLLANEGEGSRSAARRYNEATEAYVKSGRSEQAAQEAEAAVDGPEGEALRAAEEVGRKGEPRADSGPQRGEDESEEESDDE